MQESITKRRSYRLAEIATITGTQFAEFAEKATEGEIENAENWQGSNRPRRGFRGVFARES